MDTITTDTADQIGADFDDYRTDYSGRGMYGATCFAIITDDSAWRLVSDLQRALDDSDDGDEYYAALEYLVEHEPRVDSLGLDTIYYWPGLHVSDD
jgi:hypothetical protein